MDILCFLHMENKIQSNGKCNEHGGWKHLRSDDNDDDSAVRQKHRFVLLVGLKCIWERSVALGRRVIGAWKISIGCEVSWSVWTRERNTTTNRRAEENWAEFDRFVYDAFLCCTVLIYMFVCLCVCACQLFWGYSTQQLAERKNWRRGEKNGASSASVFKALHPNDSLSLCGRLHCINHGM